MPTTIPYDPGLTLGNIVPPGLLENLLRMAELQEPIDTAQYELNDKLTLRNSLKGTILELTGMGVNSFALQAKLEEMGPLIEKAAIEYANVRVQQEEKLQNFRSKIMAVHEIAESPVDWNKTAIMKQPIAADSMKMDIQYFSFDENKQSADNTLSNIKDFLTTSVGSTWLRASAGTDTASTAIKQITKQRENHDISGTLVMSATCTHKSAAVLAPFILDVDKAIRVFNSIYTDDKDKLNVHSKSSIAQAALVANTSGEKTIPMISGATYGSSFVGMVHVLKKSST